jgi:uncharacterized protein (TIGR03083 family)
VTDRLTALHESVDHLADLVSGLGPDALTASAYPTEWTVADALSHLGSGAVILLRRLDDGLAGVDTPDDAAQSVWDEWNAKTPTDQAADALVADRALLDRLEGLSEGDRERFEFPMGPMTFGFDGFVGLRLNEHALHCWDVEVVLDPEVGITPGATECVIDNLGMWTRFTSKPTGTERTVTVDTTGPPRRFAVTLGADEVALSEAGADATADLVLPAEAFIRLIYGRLDPSHTPVVQGDAEALDELRRAFPGA